MQKFVFLTYGFKTPTPEIIAAWNEWFTACKNNIVEMAGLRAGREISQSGTRELPLDLQSITGFMIVSAESLDAAEKLAQGNPYITSIRLYEVMLK